MKDLLERSCFCVPTYILYIPGTGSSAGLWQSPSLTFSTGFKPIHCDATFFYLVKLKPESRSVELKLGLEQRICWSVLPGHCFYCSACSRRRLGRHKTCCNFPHKKLPETSLKFSSQIMARRITSCALNFTGVRHPGTESSPCFVWRAWFILSCPSHPWPPLQHPGRCHIQFSLLGCRRDENKTSPKTTPKAPSSVCQPLMQRKSSQKTSKEFPCGFIFFYSTWREPRPQEAAQLNQQLNHSPGHQLCPKLNYSESSPPLKPQIPVSWGADPQHSPGSV